MDPAVDADVPAPRGPARYLWWLVVRQRGRVALGALFGSAWMVGLTLPPYVVSRAIDDGLTTGDRSRTLAWAAVLLATGALTAWLGIMRHRTMTKVRMDASYRTVRAVVTHTMRLGASLRGQAAASEAVTIGLGDVRRISEALTVTGPGVGAVISYVVVAVLLLSVSPLLMLVVLAGVPVLAIVVGPLLSRLHGAETIYRDHQTGLTAHVADIAGGLRVLRGFGGADRFHLRYRERSQALLAEGYRVGAVTSWIHAFSTGLPVVFLAAVTWLAARMAAEGTITTGELVAVYGYVAVLVVPVTFFIEGGYELSRGLVAARRVVHWLALQPAAAPAADTDHSPANDAPREPAVLHDPDSGVRIQPGVVTALVSARSADTAAIVDRVAGLTASSATWGDAAVMRIDPEHARERILVADHDADLFAGTLREIVSGRRDRTDDEILAAVDAAMADDVVLGLPGGLDGRIEAQGRNLSGGQRQRVRLARALLADPEVLLATEPTSALDAHTEALVADRLRRARAGRTTVVTTTSVLVLDQADVVSFVVDGQVAATGDHRELMAGVPEYRHLVARRSGTDPTAAS